jgi:hypothetical protein
MNILQKLLLLVAGLTLFVTIIHSPKAEAYLKTEIKNDTVYWILHNRVLLANVEYLPLIKRLESAKKGDTVRIIVRSNRGGSVYTMQMISRAMHNSKAKVIVSVEGYAASAGAHILLQGDEAHVPPSAEVLWHTGSICYGDYGCVRLRPYVLPYYLTAVSNQAYLYPQNILKGPGLLYMDLNKFKISLPVITIHGIQWHTFKITPPGDRRYVSAEYYAFFLTGEDRWVTGQEFCKWNLGDVSLRDKREHYVGKGCVLVGVKGQ